jgi:chromosome segregation ATPase
MLKKIAAVTLGAIVAIYAVSHTKWGRYVSTACQQACKEAEDKVPVDVQISSLKAEIARLDRDVDGNRTIVARQIVDVEKMSKEVEELTAKLNQREESNARLAKALAGGATSVSFNEQTLTAKEATDKLDEGVDAATRTRSMLRSKERLVSVNKRILDANRQKLNALASEKSKLMEQVLVLEAEYRELQARQTESTIQVDDSRTAEIKRSLEKLKDRVKVEQTKQALADEASGVSADKSKSPESALRKYNDYVKGDKVEVKATE